MKVVQASDNGQNIYKAIKIIEQRDNAKATFTLASGYRRLSQEIVCGLQFLHGHGIAHRDFKPSNIMENKDGYT
ncbi:unnamed protein product [Ranitomeya imitator]|uniref:Protein kinase domain-containing protein n=1 Tax=Ranitomeya imitator TaxID=111125 RepID=A0ABN9M131_9NEOB|nr:unnamed protein product [Ranitomeya imitator]